MAHSKKQITTIIQLMAAKPWLVDRSDALDYLQGECTSDAEFELVFDLLTRLDYLDPSALTCGFRAMVDQITNVWKLNPHSTLICPPKVDSGADSGPAVVQTLKNILGKRSIRGYELVISVNKIRDHAEKRDTIVLVDDFAGTGRTISNKLKTIREIPSYKAKPPNIYICLLAAAQASRALLTDSASAYFTWREYSRGISDHYKGASLTSAKETMKAIEKRFTPVVGEVSIPLFGYGGTEVLMGWDENLPNSVFPVFWWPEKLHALSGTSEKRRPLFNRFF